MKEREYMKKIISAILAIILLVTFISCTNDTGTSSLIENTPYSYSQQYEAEKLTYCLIRSMDKTAFEENRAEFDHAKLLVVLSCVEDKDFRYVKMLPLNSNYEKEFSVPVCESIIYDILGEETDVHSLFADRHYNEERDLYEFSTDFGLHGKYYGENFEFTGESGGLNCSVSFDLYEEKNINGDPVYVNIGKYRFSYKLLTDKNCWQFAGFEKL